MPVNPLQLGSKLRFWTYGTLGLLFLSGIIWWMLQRWGMIETQFGPTVHPLATWMLRLHGLATMAFLLVLGILLPLHVSHSWRAAKNRFSGAVMLLIMLSLTFSGWLLYYAGSEKLRAIASMLHLGLGFGLPIVILMHIIMGRRSRQ